MRCWKVMPVLVVVVLMVLVGTVGGRAAVNVLLTEVPDYYWHAGCFGTACGNLAGYWDRHGLPGFYTGPTAGGEAPLSSDGVFDGIRSLWASEKGVDGRSGDLPGHMDDYYVAYESTEADPYLRAGREEHAADCIGDFIGLNQNKWTNLNGECDGNIDGYSFVFWETNGFRRWNYVPPLQRSRPVPDIPSGLRRWTRWRGYEADVFSQLADFNPTVLLGSGFTFEDLKAEIDGGYPVLLFLQNFDVQWRALANPDPMDRANPPIHGMLAYGYYIHDNGNRFVRYKNSWGSSSLNSFKLWSSMIWEADLPVRGVIGYHPLPKITRIEPTGHGVKISWTGPNSVLSNLVTQTSALVHWYVLQKSILLDPARFTDVSEPTTERELTVEPCCGETTFFRVKLAPRAEE